MANETEALQPSIVFESQRKELRAWRWFKDVFTQGWHLFLLVQTRRYRATFLGFLWLLAEPIASTLPLLVVGRALDLADSSRTQMPYVIYAFSGVMLWEIFWSAIQTSLQSFNQIRKKARMLQIDPFTPIFSSLFMVVINAAFSFLLLILIAVVLGFKLSPAVLLFPIPAAVAFLGGVVVALPLVLFNAIYQDVRMSLGFLKQVLFWTLPIVHLPPVGTFLHTVVSWNPLTPVMESWRSLIVGEVAVSFSPLAAPALLFLVLLIFVGRFFRTRFWDALEYVV